MKITLISNTGRKIEYDDINKIIVDDEFVYERNLSERLIKLGKHEKKE